jgi:hypothetical protein
MQNLAAKALAYLNSLTEEELDELVDECIEAAFGSEPNPFNCYPIVLRGIEPDKQLDDNTSYVSIRGNSD